MDPAHSNAPSRRQRQWWLRQRSPSPSCRQPTRPTAPPQWPRCAWRQRCKAGQAGSAHGRASMPQSAQEAYIGRDAPRQLTMACKGRAEREASPRAGERTRRARREQLRAESRGRRCERRRAWLPTEAGGISRSGGCARCSRGRGPPRRPAAAAPRSRTGKEGGGWVEPPADGRRHRGRPDLTSSRRPPLVSVAARLAWRLLGRDTARRRHSGCVPLRRGARASAPLRRSAGARNSSSHALAACSHSRSRGGSNASLLTATRAAYLFSAHAFTRAAEDAALTPALQARACSVRAVVNSACNATPCFQPRLCVSRAAAAACRRSQHAHCGRRGSPVLWRRSRCLACERAPGSALRHTAVH